MSTYEEILKIEEENGFEFQQTLAPSQNNPPPPPSPPKSEPTPSIFSLAYYQRYFDVDTRDVLFRCKASLFPKQDFFTTVTSADLYGPFWITTTVIFSTFVTSSMAGSIAAFLNGTMFTYDFTRLSFAGSVLYAYLIVIPLCVWAIAKFYNTVISFVETVCLYGYSMTIWIPVSIVCVVPNEFLRWSSIIVAFLLSAFFLARNMDSLTAPIPVSKVMTMILVALHFALALLFKVSFFSYDVIQSTGTV